MVTNLEIEVDLFSATWNNTNLCDCVKNHKIVFQAPEIEDSSMNETPTCECPKCQAVITMLMTRIRELEASLEQHDSTMTNHRRVLLNQLSELNRLAS